MTHDFLNDLQVGFVLAEASAECVPQDMAAKLWQKNRVTIFFLRLGFFFLIIVCTNRADSAVDGIGEINLSIASAENKAGVPINFIGAETNDLLILVFFQKGICRRTFPIVCKSCSSPLAERYCACIGINVVSAAASALTVSIPSEGVQSSRI